ncbi:CAP domain-containing protein [Jeotgalibacillus sp. R-1-5s-1]|uniref:CAP domain-containing protein n=1 Tax=Jeotgalibacillus sp. R-1-5s-1 TaxID=2555897 RepID=UPI00106ADCE0|nr:CAP domain-containing protein [Jeotgalibacillus sp. R-1-5s-1]TFE03285.1 sporulation protein [Jeotgalibacillus sp. R-1-5s-1]
MLKNLIVATTVSALMLSFTGQSADAHSKDQQKPYIYYMQVNSLNINELQEKINLLLQNHKSMYLQNKKAFQEKPVPAEKSDAPAAEPVAAPAPVAEQPAEEQAVAVPERTPAQNEAPEVEQSEPAQAQNEAPAVQQPAQEVEEQKAQQSEPAISSFEQQVVNLTNQEREKAGLAPLSVDQTLAKTAKEKSLDMQRNNYFSHTSPTYGSPFDMMKQFGVQYRSAGENIAMGQRTPEEVVKAWMNSPGHRQNILSSSYTHIGVGHAENGNYWTQMFIGK